MNNFEKEKIDRLLWCDRHCCLCGKPCGIDIEFAHLPGREGSNNIDDLVPLCSGCHTKIGAYNPKHTKGTKYKAAELEARREQIYETYTSHLVPPIDYQITQRQPRTVKKRELPDVGFPIQHLDDRNRVKVETNIEIIVDGERLGHPSEELYSGKKLWHMNPRLFIFGHFHISEDAAKKVKGGSSLRVMVSVTIIDSYKREHELFPIGWVYMHDKNSWYADPTA